jgi:hypothetical protein
MRGCARPTGDSNGRTTPDPVQRTTGQQVNAAPKTRNRGYTENSAANSEAGKKTKVERIVRRPHV